MGSFPPSSIETVESGGGTLSVGSDGMISRSVDLRFLISGMESYTAAEAKAQAIAPLIYDGHRRGNVTCTPVGGGYYQVSVNYANEGVNAYEAWGILNPDDVRVIPSGISVDTTGGTEHVTQSLYTSGYQVDGPDAPDSYGAINVSGNQVNGVTKTVPAFNFSETWMIPAWYLLVGKADAAGASNDDGESPGPTIPFAQKLRELTGTTNKDKWRIFQKGEVLFLGARYDVSRASTMVPVTYSFSVKPTRTDFDVGDIKVYFCRGWDNLNIQYEDVSEGNVAVKKPKYVYVDQIYEDANFAELGIGMHWGQHFMFTGDTFTHPIVDAKKGKA